MQSYYKLPLNCTAILAKKELEKCSMPESIGRNIHLILTSEYGESRYDETYGCTLWDQDFENIVAPNSWKDKIAQSIKRTIAVHEIRLENLEVKTEIGQEELHGKDKKHLNRIKKRVDVTVTGKLVLTNEPFKFFEKLYISPLSFD